MNPFDLKAALLAKHAQHVALVHFPIALIFVGAAFDALSQRRKDLSLLRAAYYTTMAAAIAAIPTVVTGIAAWQWQFEGKHLRGNLKLHLLLALVSSTLIGIVCGLHILQQRKPRAISPRIRLAVEAIAVAFTLLTAHVGGFLSGVNGPS
jgi:uncharacterized membrane protein